MDTRSGLRSLRVAAIAAALLVTLAPEAWSQARSTLFGARAGYFTQVSEPFVGVELVAPVSSSVYFNPNVEYVFIDDATMLMFNGDFHYDFATASPNFVWVGAGLGLMYVDPDGDGDSQTDPGVNLLIGAGAGGGNVIPYGQAKLMLADDTELGVAVGLRF